MTHSVIRHCVVTRMQQELIDEIDEALGVSFNEAGILLRKYRFVSL
jgi:hypothetical protein